MLESSKKIGKICLGSYIWLWAFIGFVGFVTIPGCNWKEKLEINSLSMETMNNVWCMSMAISITIFIFERALADTGLKEDILMLFLYGAVLYGVNYLMFVTRNFMWLFLYVVFMLLMKLGMKCYYYYRKEAGEKHGKTRTCN